MRKWLFLLSVSCSGCSTMLVATPPQPVVHSVPIETVKIVEVVRPAPLRPVYPPGVLSPKRTIGELLVDRLEMCASSELIKSDLTLDASHSDNAAGLDVEFVDEAQLNILLLASCQPAKTPEVLNQLLANLTNSGTWPEEYAAFFDMLITGQRAYASVERVYEELKAEHEKTIQGLSEIETQIESQNVGVTQ